MQNGPFHGHKSDNSEKHVEGKLRIHIPFPELVIRTLKLRRIYCIHYLHNKDTGKGLLPRGDDTIL